jgi:dTDP-3-amino-3,4,6-trideoxy-alpha-D-glucose transaminase
LPSNIVGPLSEPVPYLDLNALARELDGELERTVARVASSGWYLLGPELEAFESEFAAYCGSRHCVGVGSGMSAIELALLAAGVEPGDEVIVPAYTWIATWLAVSRVGATPVAVDADASYNIDPEQIAAAIGKRTTAIVPVHLRGEPADMEAVTKLADDAGLLVIEDAAQAHGARCHGRRVGGIGKAGAFSFYPTKNLGCLGDGGAVVTDDDGLAERVRLLRNYGMRNRYEVETAGVNSRLAEIQAAVLRLLLPRLDDWNRARSSLAALYASRLGASDSISLPSVPSWADPVWHLFTINHPDREAAARELAEAEIGTLVHYPLLPHQTPPYEEKWPRRSMPVAEGLAASTLSLPLYPQLEASVCARVAEAVLATVGSAAPRP